MLPLTPTQKHEQRLQMQQQGINAAATAKHNALKAAGGLASDKTLRDEFAMAALASSTLDSVAFPDAVAVIAYRSADAMLEARKTTEGDV
jgi:hypothetical protein